MVREERLELSRLAALEPKSSVSTNSTTLARGWEIVVETALSIKMLLSPQWTLALENHTIAQT